ncbi:MAG: hypothetical protein PHI27_05580 [Eubacteriales bacterium]|nr:hypothetical protein [Eubacteriales bacterium]
MNQSIFRKKSLEHIASPDKLDEYLKASSPSVWLVLAALVLALAAAGAWCFFGSIPTTLSGVGLSANGNTVVYISAESAYSVSAGMEALYTDASGETLSGKVSEIGEIITAGEAANASSAPWLAGSMPAEWVCPVSVSLDSPAPLTEGALSSAQIVLSERRPIDLLLGR